MKVTVIAATTGHSFTIPVSQVLEYVVTTRPSRSAREGGGGIGKRKQSTASDHQGTNCSILNDVSANLKKHLATLSKRGPHRVLVGDLAYAGLEGKVYAPAEGNGVPGIAFGHDWRKKIKNYHATLRHLASWGIVVAAPDTETGLVPNHRAFAADLESALQIVAGVRLGQGNVTVSPAKLGFVGHGMGAGAAVLAAVDNQKVRAVGALYPATVAPAADVAARNIRVPGLILGSAKDDIFSAGNPAKLAQAWGGKAIYHELTKGTQAGFTEDNLAKLAFGGGAFQSGATETARALLTGFLLATLNNDKKYEAFAEVDATAKGLITPTTAELAERTSFTSFGSR